MKCKCFFVVIIVVNIVEDYVVVIINVGVIKVESVIIVVGRDIIRRILRDDESDL